MNNKITIQKPVRRTITTNQGIKYNLPFPYVVFNDIKYLYYNEDYEKEMEGQQLRVAFCNEYPKEGSILYRPPLSNIYEDYRVCISGNKGTNIDNISYFWQSSFVLGASWHGVVSSLIIFRLNWTKYDFGTLEDRHKALSNWSKISLDQVTNINWGKTVRELPPNIRTFKQFKGGK